MLRHLRLTLLPALAATACVMLPVAAWAQQPPPSRPANQQSPDQLDDPSDLRTLTQQNSILSLQGAERLMTDADSAISSQNYGVAATKLQDARQVFNQLSNFYQELGTSFAGIDNRISEGLRQKALQTAQQRDQATYQLALVHRAQNRPELSVPLLIQIIRSQQPTRELGQQAYQQLLELGFVESPFRAPQARQPQQPIQGLPSQRQLEQQLRQRQQQQQPAQQQPAQPARPAQQAQPAAQPAQPAAPRP